MGDDASMKSWMFLLAVLAFSSMSAADVKTDTAVVGGGCFWCTEAEYQTVPGIIKVESGYAGGTVPNPTYNQVCTGQTGHAEVVQITFDPAKISYEKVIDLFWKAHDPTTLNRQGADEGTQYRSIILYKNEAEKAAAEKSMAAAQKDFKKPIVTQIVPLTAFYPAEEHHQDFYKNNPNYGYSRAVIAPKLEHFKNAQ
ncbi:peptide-methionine (S)-S-oxide reductase MsrA [soil metagenome]